MTAGPPEDGAVSDPGVTPTESAEPIIGDQEPPLPGLDVAGLLDQLLPLRSLAVQLVFTADSHPRYFHQAAVSALLRHLLQPQTLESDDFSRYLVIDTPESGRRHYRAGDAYHFTILCLAGGEPLLARLMAALRALPDSLPKTLTESLTHPANPIHQPHPLAHSLADGDSQRQRRHAFGDNLRWRGFSDNFVDASAAVDQVDQLAVYELPQLAQETALWAAEHAHIRWQWLTPVRLLKEKTARKRVKGEARYCADAADLSAELLLARLYDSLSSLLHERGQQRLPPRPAPPPVTLDDRHCVWVDSHYLSADGKAKVMGGLLGDLRLTSDRPLPPPWAHLLVLGQYVGIGQRRSFGWGRYQLVTRANTVTCQRQLAARSLLASACTPAVLIEALRHKYSRLSASSGAQFKWQREAEAAAIDDRWLRTVDEGGEDCGKGYGEECEEYEEASPSTSGELPPSLLRRAEILLAADYQPPDLRGVLIEKNDGHWRALAVPPFYDAVLQRAVAQVLGAVVDGLMDVRSVGYRKGYSRLHAREHIQRAYRQGARWVVEADIDDFFDSVDIAKVARCLQTLLHQDPINDAILAWLQAPVSYQGLRLPRTRGLPQGSPLSPVIANLLLDDFDADMRKADFECIRFADDFVVLCKTQAEAGRALARARSSLSEHGLQLDAGKTRITSFAHGFRFLGYLCVNELALDVGSKTLTDDAKTAASDKSSRESNKNSQTESASGWLADFLRQRPDAQLQAGSATAPVAAQVSPAAEHSPVPSADTPIALGERQHHGAFVCITGRPAAVSTENGRLCAMRDDKTLIDTPWRGLRAVLLLGRHHVTSPAMHAAMTHGVPIHFGSRGGEYLGLLSNDQPRRGPRLWRLQQERSADPEACLAVAKSLVDARLRHQREVLRQRGLEGGDALASGRRQLAACDELSVLLGIEGQASKRYFAAIASGLDRQWGFNGRNRRPPKDPLNALLSLGYTLLYAHTKTLLIVDGLDPWAGFYHQNHGAHCTLASDMMEPFRHVVERVALSFLSSGVVTPQDFTQDAQGACWLNATARKQYVMRLSERFEQKIQGRDGQSGRLVDLLGIQNQSMIRFIRARELFSAWVQR